jgi:hypothetical protein
MLKNGISLINCSHCDSMLRLLLVFEMFLFPSILIKASIFYSSFILNHQRNVINEKSYCLFAKRLIIKVVKKKTILPNLFFNTEEIICETTQDCNRTTRTFCPSL